jgi:hypothetical protein
LLALHELGPASDDPFNDRMFGVLPLLSVATD